MSKSQILFAWIIIFKKVKYLLREYFRLLQILVFLIILIPESNEANPTEYWDGDRSIKIMYQPQLLAELTGLGTNNSKNSMIARADTFASLSKNFSGINVWNSNYLNTINSMIKTRLATKNFISKNILPVFLSEDGSIMIPKGNIIVYFHNNIDSSSIQKWAAHRGLRAIQRLPFAKKNVWEIETEPGFISIELANDVIGDSEVETAIPNWWVEFSKK